MPIFRQHSPNIEILFKRDSSFRAQTGLSTVEIIGFNNMLYD